MILTGAKPSQKTFLAPAIQWRVDHGGQELSFGQQGAGAHKKIFTLLLDFTLATDDELAIAADKQDQIGMDVRRVSAQQTAHLGPALAGYGQDAFGCIRKTHLAV